MIVKITAKNCEISNFSYNYIGTQLNRIVKLLPDIEDDLVVFRLLIKKNTDKYHPRRVHPHVQKTYADRKTALAFYEGTVSFRLEKNQLFVHFKGQTIDECLNLGFERIIKEIKKFKNIHFPAESEYPNHQTIRKSA